MKVAILLSAFLLGTLAVAESNIKIEKKLLSLEESIILNATLDKEGWPVYAEGNDGDLIYRNRDANDALIVRDVVINEGPSNVSQDVTWNVNTGRQVTSVRVLNFGRQIAYALSINVSGGSVVVNLRFPQNVDPRLIIEVYAF